MRGRGRGAPSYRILARHFCGGRIKTRGHSFYFSYHYTHFIPHICPTLLTSSLYYSTKLEITAVTSTLFYFGYMAMAAW